MFIIELDFFLPSVREQLKTEGVVWFDDAFILDQERKQGTILTPPQAISPEWGYEFKGFEVFPSEYYIDVAIYQPHLKKYFKFYDFWSEAVTLQEWTEIQIEQLPRWKPVSSPVFYSCTEIRELLSYWTGPIQFLIRLNSLKTSNINFSYPYWRSDFPLDYYWVGQLEWYTIPKCSGIKVGFHVLEDTPSFLLKYALPKFYSIETILYRNTYIELEKEQDDIFCLQNIPFEKIKSPHIAFPGYPHLPLEKNNKQLILKRYLKYELLEDLKERSTPGITKSGSPAKIIFYYDISAEPVVYNQGIFQVSEIPTVLIANTRRIKTYSLPSLFIRGYKENYQIDRIYCDLEFEVTVVASSEEELARILDIVRGKSYTDAKIDLAPWGTTRFINSMSGVEYQPKIGALETQRSASFRITIAGCPSATYKKKI